MSLLNVLRERQRLLNRRWFLRDCGVGLGAMALADLARGAEEAKPKTHHEPKAKRVIYLFMGGAPSHLELFDNKPQLAKFDGTLPPPDLLKGYRAAFINGIAWNVLNIGVVGFLLYRAPRWRRLHSAAA